LGLVEDTVFITRIMPLVSVEVLGNCLREEGSWANCKSQLLDEYFLYFTRERLIRDLVVFNFQGEGQPLRTYIEQIFQVADFLQYEATEQQLVDRVVMNFHPWVLSQAALLGRPQSLKALYCIVAVIEEKCLVARETSGAGSPVREPP